MARHIHLDPLGGAAGDMIVACLCNAFPEHAAAAVQAAEVLSGAPCRLQPHSDGVLAGARFTVAAEERGHHAHAHWRDIRARLAEASPEPARRHAIGIFSLLAEAEARVHGVAPDDVTFHEVGAADSIADIVAAASLIAALSPASWSVGPLPLGSGRVLTTHGPMPVPAPATAILLEGFATLDDGVPGERVTPTGAAILRHLACAPSRPAGVLRATGTGFGTRRLPGLSNCLRALALDVAEPAAAGPHRELAVIAFEVDDQSPEDLAAGLDRLRATAGVHDVLQSPAFGKKGRMTVHVQALCRPDALDAAVAACFAETTTIGLRTHLVQGRALPRRFAEVAVGDRQVRVKLAERPGHVTAKAEADDLLAEPTHAARARLRREAEAKATEA